MVEIASATGAAQNVTVRVVNGPVPADDPSHALRLAAAIEHVARMRAELARAEADLAQLQTGKGN